MNPKVMLTKPPQGDQSEDNDKDNKNKSIY